MPSFSRQLEESLHRAVAYANQRKHEYATLEHLLLSLVDDEDAASVMRACDPFAYTGWLRPSRMTCGCTSAPGMCDVMTST